MATQPESTTRERDPFTRQGDNELTDDDLDLVAGGIRNEQLNNKYPENMKHETRDSTKSSSTLSTGG